MTETLTSTSRHDSAPEDETTTSPERPDNRHASLTAHALDRTANFLLERANRLNQRAVDNAHEAALDEYRDTDRDAYAEHMQNLTEATDEAGNPIQAQQEYAANRLTEERNSAHNEALKEYRDRDHAGYVDHLSALADEGNSNESAQNYGQEELNRENRRESRAEAREKAGKMLRRFGKAVGNRLRDAGLITLGLGLMGAEAAGNKMDSMRQERANRKATAETNKAERKAKREQNRADKAAERERNRANKAAEIARRSTEAQERKNKRRERRAARRRKIGRVGRRTRAAGNAFKEAWKNYQEDV